MSGSVGNSSFSMRTACSRRRFATSVSASCNSAFTSVGPIAVVGTGAPAPVTGGHLHLEGLFGLRIVEHDLAALGGRGLETKLREERREACVVGERDLVVAAAVARRREEMLSRGVQGDDLIVVVDDDDRVRDAAKHEVEPVALGADLQVGGLDALGAARELL